MIIERKAKKYRIRSNVGFRKYGFFILAFVMLGLILFEPVLSYFGQVGQTVGNIFNLADLDLQASSDTAGFEPTVIGEGVISQRAITVSNAGTMPFQYQLAARKASGDMGICENLRLKALLNNQIVFDGGLLGSPIASSTIGEGSVSDNWQFQLSSTAGLDSSGQCAFDLVFDARQIENIDASYGFTDKKEISNTISATSLLAPQVLVEFPNGGQQFYIIDDKCLEHQWCREWCANHGMNQQCEYQITWDAKSEAEKGNSALWIDIWYLADGGASWPLKVAEQVPNSGKFLWKIPFDNSLTSNNAVIKVVASTKKEPVRWGNDISDAPFSASILFIEDLINQTSSLMPDLDGQTAIQTATTTETMVPESPAPVDVQEQNDIPPKEPELTFGINIQPPPEQSPEEPVIPQISPATESVEPTQEAVLKAP